MVVLLPFLASGVVRSASLYLFWRDVGRDDKLCTSHPHPIHSLHFSGSMMARLSIDGIHTCMPLKAFAQPEYATAHSLRGYRPFFVQTGD